MPLYGGNFSPNRGQTLGTVSIANYFFPMAIIELKWSGLQRGAIEVTGMAVQPVGQSGSGWGYGNRQFIESTLVDPGEIALIIYHDPNLFVPIQDPYNTGPQFITITLGPAANQQQTFTCLGFMTYYEIDGPFDGKAVTAHLKIKLTDVVDNTYPNTGAVGIQLAS